MKKLHSRVLCFLCMVCMISTMVPFSALALAQEEVPYDPVAAKHALVARARADRSNRQRAMSSLAEEESNEILLKMACGLIEDTKSLRQELEDSGVYILDTPTENEPAPHISPDSSCVSMSKPIVSYNDYTGYWSVTGGGYYTDTSWLSQTAMLPKEDVGGRDAYGVSYTGTNSRYSTTIVKQNAFISDGVGTERTSNSISVGGDKCGFGFEFQDYSWGEHDGMHPFGHTYYVGKHFSTQLVYTSDFIDFSGNAKSYHVHTFDNAELKKVVLSTSGISVTVDITDKSFTAISSQVRF